MLVIDRFEAEKAIIESSEGIIKISKKELPEKAKEGDVLKIIIDKEQTSSRKQTIKELSEELFD